MATEVTKLISVSLGKMHQSRQTKCGLNLRKSLLVASVLHKARDVYVTEIKNRKVDISQKCPEEPVTAPEPVRKRRFTSQRSLVEAQTTEAQSTTTDADIESSKRLKTNSNVTQINRPKPVIESQTPASVSDDILEQLAVESESSTNNNSVDKENNPPSSTDITELSSKLDTSTLSCGRCLKRRYSRHDSYLESSNGAHDDSDSFVRNPDESEHSAQKRSRIDSTKVNESSFLSALNSESTSQINSLVKIFSQSFPEFNATEDHSSSDKPSELNTFSMHLRESIALTA